MSSHGEPRLPDDLPQDAVAVVGMAGRLPGAEALDDFWNALESGADLIRREFGPNGVVVRAGGFVDDLEGFDRGLFPVSRREAEVMDPQHRMFLECCWNALEDASVPPRGNPTRTGLFGGVGISSYLVNNLLPAAVSRDRTFLDSAADLQLLLASDKDYLTARLAYQLDLIGPVVNVQAACATGLYAVHLAVQSLLNGECDLALAAAASASVPQLNRHSGESELVLAPSGRCRPFDQKADGTVFSSAAAAVVLKRLEDAITDGDAIRAVMLGSAIGNDGSARAGFTAPSATGQARVMRQALHTAGLSAEDVDYVEAHGTGTPVGDPIEASGIVQAYARHGSRRPLLVGSVKGAVGHTGSASGLVSLVRTVLMLENRRLHGVQNLEKVNPEIDAADGALHFLTGNQPWPSSPLTGTRTAGVSSFGLGGFNAHVLLRENPLPTARRPLADGGSEPDPLDWHLLPLSAASAPSLRARARAVLQTEPDLRAAEHALITGRTHLGHRGTVVARGWQDAARALTAVVEGRRGGPVRRDARLAMLFTGHYPVAAQHAVALRSWPAARRIIDEAEPLLEQAFGAGLEHLAERTQGPAAGIAVKQPLQYVLQCALVELWREWGLHPAVVLGHSVGEYAAAWTAGVFDLATGLRLVTARAALLGSLPTRGAMAALAVDPDTVADIIATVGGDLEVAALNGPRNTVVAGSAEYVDQAVRSVREAGFRARPLDSGVASHTSHVRPALAALAETVPEAQLRRPRLPMISCVTGDVVDTAVRTKDYWVSHLSSPVDFVSGHRALTRFGVTAFLEIGGGPVLTGLVADDVQVPGAVMTPSLRPGLDAVEQLRRSAAALYDHGLPVDLVAVAEPSPLRPRLRLPGYTFNRTRHWVEPPEDPRARLLHAKCWRPAPEELRKPRRSGRWLLVGTAGDPLVAAVRGALLDQGHDVDVVEDSPQEVVAAITHQLDHDGGPRSGLIWFAPPRGQQEGPLANDLQDRLRPVVEVALELAQVLHRRQAPALRSWWITRNGQAVLPGDDVDPVHAMVPGLLRTLAREDPDLQTRRVDLDCRGTIDEAAVAVLDALTRTGESEGAYRSGQLYHTRLATVAPPASTSVIRSDGCYLVTGGTGGLGLLTARLLLRQGAGRVVLAGRSAAERWDEAALGREFGDHADRVQVRRCDVTRAGEVSQLVRDLRAGELPLRGIVHAAVELHDAAFANITREQLAAVMAVQARGAALLVDAAEGTSCEFVCLYSSATGLLGNPGQAGYGAASAYLDALAELPRADGLRIQSLVWGPWRAASWLTTAPDLLPALERSGMGSLSVDQGERLLGQLLGARAGVLSVLPNDWGRWCAGYSWHEGRLLDEVSGPQPSSIASPSQASISTTAVVPPPRVVLPVDDPDALQEMVMSVAAAAVAEVLGREPAPDEPLVEVGLDSLSAIVLRNHLMETFGIRLEALACVEAGTVAALAGLVLAEVGTPT